MIIKKYVTDLKQIHIYHTIKYIINNTHKVEWKHKETKLNIRQM